MTNTVKKFLAVGVAAAFVFGVFGYAAGSYREDQAVTTKTSDVVAAAPAYQAPARTTAESMYLLTLGTQPTLNAKSYPDDTWLSEGRWVCTNVASGHSMYELTLIMRSGTWQLTTYEAGYVYGASLAAFCPQYQWTIKAPFTAPSPGAQTSGI